MRNFLRNLPPDMGTFRRSNLALFMVAPHLFHLVQISPVRSLDPGTFGRVGPDLCQALAKEPGSPYQVSGPSGFWNRLEWCWHAEFGAHYGHPEFLPESGRSNQNPVVVIYVIDYIRMSATRLCRIFIQAHVPRRVIQPQASFTRSNRARSER
jgi:hypothetical protein